jgi:hypothetical protein
VIKRAVLAAVIGLTLAVASAHLTVGSETVSVCTDCCLHRHRSQLLGFNTDREWVTPFSEWHARRVRGHVAHTWNDYTITGLNVWGTPTYHRLGHSENWLMMVDDDRLARVLKRLEPMGLDIEFHGLLTNPGEARQSAARSTTWCFDARWSDDQVLNWWRQTQRHLVDPSGWGLEFRAGTHPVDRIPRFPPRPDPNAATDPAVPHR